MSGLAWLGISWAAGSLFWGFYMLAIDRPWLPCDPLREKIETFVLMVTLWPFVFAFYLLWALAGWG